MSLFLDLVLLLGCFLAGMIYGLWNYESITARMRMIKPDLFSNEEIPVFQGERRACSQCGHVEMPEIINTR